ncbi:hypothetical protein TanjilG_25791 [Lupinus angustifolius]|uniref:OVATE domain-containing protein n=1 Tax=Lupinus angustifolius TaxID=3871 RepID=A0A1J7HGC1_LUPAN|nr:PREDICTED: uncharacterized protein LOC109347819 [Lupinus angustifolius]XP_019443436.1 PREDICTED: uncharacterized protein LOC109347819 [Lupinus angustifolius]OIW11878.1 hypothetical protein TanjilG_25791 [Lupinus angustifolius]
MQTLEDKASCRKPRPSFIEEPQMMLRGTIHKTKVFIHKRLKTFRSFFFGGYQRLPRSLSFNPFHCRSGNARTYTNGQLYNDFYDHLQSDLSIAKTFGNNDMSKSKEPAVEDAACSGSFMSFPKQSSQKNIHDDKAEEKKNKVGPSKLGNGEDLSSKNMKKETHVLAQKMKDLDMIDAEGDLEHVLDIEEALHYYSCLKSPVYLDIVDKFFVDMHSEFSAPQPSVKIKPSTKRLHSVQHGGR